MSGSDGLKLLMHFNIPYYFSVFSNCLEFHYQSKALQGGCSRQPELCRKFCIRPLIKIMAAVLETPFFGAMTRLHGIRPGV